MGKIQRSAVFKTATDAVFSARADAFVGPLQSPFGWHIFHVIAIEPPTTAPFEEVRPMLEKDLKQHNADDALNKTANQLEDALAGGTKLADVAHELGLKMVSI